MGAHPVAVARGERAPRRPFVVARLLAKGRARRVGFPPMSGERVRRLSRIVVGLAGAGIGGFHLRILWTRLADGSVLDPVVAARWVTSVAIALVFIRLHRRGVSLVRGRAALVLWLLVALLHGVALVPAVAATTAAVMPADVFLVATPLVGVATLAWAGALVMRDAGKALFARLALAAPLASPPRLERDLLAASGPRAPPG